MERLKKSFLVQSILCLLAAFVVIFFASHYIMDLFTKVLIFSIAALGLNLLYGYAGQISLAQAAFMAIGSYSMALLGKNLIHSGIGAINGFYLLIGFLFALLISAVAGVLLAYPAVRVSGPYLAMMTLAFGWAIWKVLLEWVSFTGGELGISSIPRVQLGPVILEERGLVVLTLALFLLVLFLKTRLIHSRFGLYIRAISVDERTVASVGINVKSVKLLTFVFSSMFAGLAGALFTLQQQFINPDSFKPFDSIYLLLAVLLGGPGTFLGPVAGTACLVLLPYFLHVLDSYRLIVYGILILVSLYFMPKGLLGYLRQKDTDHDRLDDDTEPEFAGDINNSSFEYESSTFEIKSARKKFGGIKAVDDVSLKIEKGSIHSVIGPNGAGKTTLINLASGKIKADKGHFALDGKVLPYYSLYKSARIGIVRTFQDFNSLEALSLLDNIILGLTGRKGLGLKDTIRKIDGKRMGESNTLRGQAKGLLKMFGLESFMNQLASQLPQGHRRMLEIARAVATRPKILLLDEPAAGLNKEEKENLSRVLMQLRDGGMSILLVEHNMDFVWNLSDIVTVLDNGKILFTDRPENVRENVNVREAYLGRSYADFGD